MCAPHVLADPPDSPHLLSVHALEGGVEAGVGSLHPLQGVVLPESQAVSERRRRSVVLPLHSRLQGQLQVTHRRCRLAQRQTQVGQLSQ